MCRRIFARVCALAFDMYECEKPTFVFVFLRVHMFTLVSVHVCRIVPCVFKADVELVCAHVCETTHMFIRGAVYGVNSLQINTSREMDVLLRCQVAKQGVV